MEFPPSSQVAMLGLAILVVCAVLIAAFAAWLRGPGGGDDR